MSQVVVDDQDPRVIYGGDWVLRTIVGASGFNETLSAAVATGSTASFNFLGTKIAVYGYQGSTESSGQPTTTYAIDGVVISNYTAPIVVLENLTDDTLFFESSVLPNGNHNLLITVTNGTQPNTYYLDYLNYTSSVVYVTVDSSVTIQSSSDSTALVPSQSTSVSNVSSSPTRVGPIIGGALGGIVLLVALASFLFICLKRRDSKYERPPSQIEQIPGVTPFNAWERRALFSGSQETNLSTHTQDMKPSSTSSPSHSRLQVTSLLIPSLQSNQPVSGPSTPRIRQSIDATCGSPTGSQAIESRPLPADAEERKNPAPSGQPNRPPPPPPPSSLPQQETANQVASSSDPIVQHHVDSGVRLPPVVVEFPPPYTAT